MPEAFLKYHQKSEIFGRYILELKIWEISDFKRYPNNLKYSLFFMDTRSQKKVLFDNHHPKGHHYHINDNEFIYNFFDEDNLIDDFKLVIFNQFGVKL